jgi:hypothetical protein
VRSITRFSQLKVRARECGLAGVKAPCALHDAQRSIARALRAGSPSVLLREFLGGALEADFSRTGGVVGTLPAPIPFRSLLGRADYDVASLPTAPGTR